MLRVAEHTHPDLTLYDELAPAVELMVSRAAEVDPCDHCLHEIMMDASNRLREPFTRDELLGLYCAALVMLGRRPAPPF